MIFDQGQYMGDEYTPEQLRAIAASKAAAASVGVKAVEAAATGAQSQAAFDQAVSSYIAALPASRARAPWYQGKGLLIAGGVGAGALVLFLAMRKKKKTRVKTK